MNGEYFEMQPGKYISKLETIDKNALIFLFWVQYDKAGGLVCCTMSSIKGLSFDLKIEY